MLQLVMVASYLLLTTAVSLYFKKSAHKSTGDFYTAGGRMPMLVVMTFMFAETIAGSGTIGNAANAFEGGLSRAVWANWGMALGCILYVLTVSRFYRTVFEKYGAMTIPEAYSVIFGERVRVLLMCIIALVNIILYSTQASAAASILAPLIGVDAKTMTWLITAVFIVTAMFGGMTGVAWINVLHAVIMFAGVAVVTIVTVNSAGGFSALNEAVPAGFLNVIGDKPLNTAADAMGMAISFIASANAANAVFVAKSEKAANGGMLLAGLMAAVFALMPAFIGISARVVMPSIVPNSALYLMSSGQGEVFGGIIAMSIIAAILSTAPGLLIVVAATLTKDLYLTVIRPKASEKQQLKFTMFVIFAAGVIGTQIGIGKEAILDNMLGAFQIRSIAGIVLLTALAWPRVDERSAFWSMLGGGAASAYWFFFGSSNIAPLWVGAGVCLAILLVMTLFSKNQLSDGYQKYLQARNR